jgi:hypothetical protein
MVFSRIARYFNAPNGTEAKETVKSYGWVKYNHLKPYMADVGQIGVFDPDILLLALKKFLKDSNGIVNEIRIATYPHREADSLYIMIQDAETTEPDRWMGVGPKQWIEQES